MHQSSSEGNSGPDGRQSGFKLNSVGAQFRSQLKGLMGTLTQCQPHYVRRDIRTDSPVSMHTASAQTSKVEARDCPDKPWHDPLHKEYT